ncbi:MAG: cytochrome c [Bacteroidota bacterium]
MMMLKKYLLPVGAFLLVAGSLTGCYNDKSKRNIEYAPQMYHSVPLEPYSQTVLNEDSGLVKVFANAKEGNAFFNGLAAQAPPEGTLPRADSWYYEEAYTPYYLPNTEEGYVESASNLSPLNDPATNEANLNCTQASYDRGKVLYQRFCIMCHGPNGKGKGILVTKETFLGAVPAYNDAAHRDLTAGTMFHSITYGKGNMGSYASQLTPKERWEVVCYIQEFQEQE